MKYAILLGLLLVLSSPSFASETDQLQGAWELVRAEYRSGDSVMVLPASPHDHRMKIISKSHFATVGQDTTNEDSNVFNGGTYTLNGDFYTETHQYFSWTESIGRSISFKIEFKNDTFIIRDATNQENPWLVEEWRRVE